MDNKVKEALGSASYLTYHWRQYSFEQLEKEMVRVCGLCDKALGRFKDDSITDFERGQWSVIQNVIGYVENYSLAAELCREAGIGYKKIKALQKDCGYSYKEEVNDFLKESRNCGTDLKLEDQLCLGQQQIKVAVNIFLQKNLAEMKVIHYGFALSYIYMGIGTQIPDAVTFLKDKKDGHHALITAVDDDTCGMSLNGNAAWSLSGIKFYNDLHDQYCAGAKKVYGIKP